MIEFLFCPQHGIVWRVLPFGPAIWWWVKERLRTSHLTEADFEEIRKQMEIQDLETRCGG